MDESSSAEFPDNAPSSEVRSPRVAQRDFSTSASDEKWRMLLEQQNRNFVALVKSMKSPVNSSELRLPDFDPSKKDIDARAWLSTADMCISDQQQDGAPLMIALSRALKGNASTWLSTVSFPGMTWSNFKEIFIARYDCPETPASFLINLNGSKPKDSECLSAYAASLMTSIMSKWNGLSTEQIAIATVLAHISQYESRVQRLSFTTDIKNRNQLQQELKAVSFLKRKAPTSEDSSGADNKRSRPGMSNNVQCYNCGRRGHTSTVCRSKKNTNMKTQDDHRSPHHNDTSIKKSSNGKSSVTCFNCQGLGHYASACPKTANKGASGAGQINEKRVDVCTVAAPRGTLQHSGTELERLLAAEDSDTEFNNWQEYQEHIRNPNTKTYPCPLYVWRVVRNTTRAERLSCAFAALALALCMSLIFYFTYAARQEGKVIDRAPHEWNITREDWLARDTTDNNTVERFAPLKLVIVQHTVSPECHRFTDCAAELRNLQGYFMDSPKLGYDLPYNFLIGNDGRVYESRGWNREGAHTAGYNRCSLGVAFVGDYRSSELIHSRVTDLQLQRFSMLLEEGVARGFLRPDYSILGAKDVRPTVSPGDILHEALKTMEHFENKYSFKNMTCEEVYDKLGIPYD